MKRKIVKKDSDRVANIMFGISGVLFVLFLILSVAYYFSIK